MDRLAPAYQYVEIATKARARQYQLTDVRACAALLKQGERGAQRLDRQSSQCTLVPTSSIASR
jgi:hypothetical protein